MLSPVDQLEIPDVTKKAYRRARVWAAFYSSAALVVTTMLIVPGWGVDSTRASPSWAVSRCSDGVLWIRWWPGRERQRVREDAWDIGIPYIVELSDAGSFEKHGLISLHGDQVSLVIYLWWPTILAWVLVVRAVGKCLVLNKHLRQFLCMNCGYDLRGSVSDRCSECGALLDMSRR